MKMRYFPPGGEPLAKPGEVIADRYLVEKEIARGGMAHILRAEDTFLSTVVVLKVLPTVLSGNKQAIEEIKQEARIAMSLNHPNIVKLHQFENTPKYKFLVMEYVDGPSLADLIDEKGKIPLSEALGYMRDACTALDYAHSQDIVHRDIKSANFLVDSKGTVKLTDFGIAQKVRRALSKITQRQVMGTIPYMSPEQLMGRKIDYHTDIYSLGAVLYELLTGFPPFFSGSIEAQIMLKPPDPIPEVPEHVNDALLRALRKGPIHRWNSASDFYHALISKPPKEEIPAARAKLEWPEPKIQSAAKKRHFKILAVDDEEDIRTIVQAILTRKGYEVNTAFDGQDAFEKLGKTSYDLLVSDILMPRMDGVQLLSRLRTEGSDIPVLMLTALNDDKHMLESYRSGADYYMSKPFDRDKLVNAVRYLMGDFSEKEKQTLEQKL
jgi:serine/threonine protein kinase